MWQIARLQSIIGCCVAHDAIYYLMVAGNLTALNKVSEEEQAELVKTTGDRKIRPVKSGSMILKAPMQCGLKSKSAKRVIEEMKPVQLGMGTPSGPQTKVLVARLLVAQGHFASL